MKGNPKADISKANRSESESTWPRVFQLVKNYTFCLSCASNEP